MVDDRHSRLQEHAAVLAAAAKGLNATSGVSAAPFLLAFLTDAARIADPRPIIKAMPRGAAVIFRDYGHPARSALAEDIASLCRGRGLLFYVAGDLRLARECGADGVHLPAGMADGLARKPADFLISVACHSEQELATAARIRADSAFLSPVFATGSHPEGQSLGTERFKSLASQAQIPILALGGVSAENTPTLSGQNVVGFGAIGAFDPSC